MRKKEVERTVSINGVEYLERYAASRVEREQTVVAHFVYTLEDMPGGGRSAGYYEESFKDGALQFVWGFFNEGRDPQSLKDAGAGASLLKPAGQVLQGGRHFSLYAFGHEIAARGAQNPGGTLETRYALGGVGGRLANALSVGTHFAGGGVVEHSQSSAVLAQGGLTAIAARYAVGSLSPFVTLVAVENDLDVPVTRVGSGQAPSGGGSGSKTLAPTGDGATAGAAGLAALALAAAASLARRRGRG